MPEQVEITRRLEFDAGHRIPSHKSKCRNLHGHRYVLEVTAFGTIQPERGQSDDGMVVDFSDLKQIMNDAVVEPWDHAFLVFAGDKSGVTALACIKEHKTVKLDVIPTVENLVNVAASLIRDAVEDRQAPFMIRHVRLYETPNCWADWNCSELVSHTIINQTAV